MEHFLQKQWKKMYLNYKIIIYTWIRKKHVKQLLPSEIVYSYNILQNKYLLYLFNFINYKLMFKTKFRL